MKTFKVKSSAIRAAKQAGLIPNESAEIIENEDGTWSFIDRRPATAADLLDAELPPMEEPAPEKVGPEEDEPSRILGVDNGLETTRCPRCHREGGFERDIINEPKGQHSDRITCNHCGWFHTAITAPMDRRSGVEKPNKSKTGAHHEALDITRKSQTAKPCSLVWDIAESMPGAKRKDIIDACLAKGVAFYTARTQYQLWLTATRNSQK